MKIIKLFSGIYIDLFLYSIFLTYILINFEVSTINIIILTMTFGALMFWIISRVQLGSSFSLIPEAKEVVTNGIYSKIRHPIYFFTLIANLGVIYLLDNKYLYLLMPIFIIVQYIRIQKEEYLLTKKFGNKYLDYKKSTWF